MSENGYASGCSTRHLLLPVGAERATDCFEFAREGAAAVTAAEMLGQARVSARCQFSVESERERDSHGPAVVRRVVHRTPGRR